MQLPFFFEENLPVSDKFILSEETSKHVVQVLRMREKDELFITNGKGQVLTASVTNADKRKTEVIITNEEIIPPHGIKIAIGISLIKNSNRFEWFLEKATEIGVSEIIPVICHRTEKHHFRAERMKGILISAMLQSRQAWIPKLRIPVTFTDIIKEETTYERKFIAHCNDGDKKKISNSVNKKEASKIILIGPEGDFTKDEINNAVEKNYIPVTLGETRLRTETAGLVAAVLLLNSSM